MNIVYNKKDAKNRVPDLPANWQPVGIMTTKEGAEFAVVKDPDGCFYSVKDGEYNRFNDKYQKLLSRKGFRLEYEKD